MKKLKMDFIEISNYSPEVHGTYLPALMNRNHRENIIMVVYMADGNSSKWWTSYPDGGLRACGEPDMVWACVSAK